MLDPTVLNWYSALYGTADGYGNSAERMIQALERAGRTVCVEAGYGMSSHETLIGGVLGRPYVPGTTRIVYAAPGMHWLKRHPDQFTIGFTMWEDDTLPASWNEYIVEPDAIAAPSRFCCEVIERRLLELGVEKPVFRIPLGVAHDELPFRRRSYDPDRDTFTFLWTAVTSKDPRKGAFQAIAAFRDAFTHGERVRLIMRSSLGQIYVDDRRIEWRVGPITETQKRELLYEAHACIYPSFGEGFGLMPLEAIATGLPAICSDNTALREYRELFVPIGCDAEPSGILGPAGKVETTGTWSRPRHEEIVLWLRAMPQFYPYALAQAAAAAGQVRERFGYEHTVAAIAAALRNRVPA